MIAIDDARCRKCKKGICFRVDVSRLEEGLGHEKFRCDHCGAMFKIIPKEGGPPTLIEVGC